MFCSITFFSIFLSESVQNNDFNSFKTVTKNYAQLYQNIENNEAYLEKICQKNFGKSLNDPRESKQSSYSNSPKKSASGSNNSSAGGLPGGLGGLGGADLGSLLGNIDMDQIGKMMGGMPSGNKSSQGGASQQTNANPFGGMDMGAMAGMAQQMMANNPNLLNDIGAMFGGASQPSPSAPQQEKKKPAAPKPAPAANPFGGMDMGAMAGMAQQMMANNPNLLRYLSK